MPDPTREQFDAAAAKVAATAPAGLSRDEFFQRVQGELNRNTPLNEPTTEGAGRLKGVKDYANDLGRSMFESLARPGLKQQEGDPIEGQYQTKPRLQAAGDFVALMAPSLSPAKSVPADIPKITEPIGNRILRFGARRAADALDLTPNIVNSKMETKAVDALRSIGAPRPGPILDRYMPNSSGPVQQGVEHAMPPQNEAVFGDMPNQGATQPTPIRTPQSSSPISSGMTLDEEATAEMQRLLARGVPLKDAAEQVSLAQHLRQTLGTGSILPKTPSGTYPKGGG